jgi:collagenase-like PrtC family protease
MDKIELLAPAKDLETGLAAINCGADAVYIGAPRFGARQAAGNPLADIEKLAAYAHRYWARVYATVNTLLQDDELEDAQRLIKQLYQVGIDALIIQDAGLLECDLPPLPLFASTQMHNHNPERVAFLEKVGFRRAILARELSLEQISAIRAATSIELETFIHGALCVGYSGQCYLSYAIGGRSGNRGQCAQPCRRRYSLVDQNGKMLVRNRYLLSLKDLNLSAHLDDLLRVGVTSFKIEGRLKDKSYIMNVVGHYRQQLDALLPNFEMRPASSGKVNLGFTPDPAKTFNRGYTTYYLKGRGAPVAAPDTPRHTGEAVGRVAEVKAEAFSLDCDASLHSGDGIAFFDAENELQGTLVNHVQGCTVYPAKMTSIQKGMPIYRNHDHEFLQQVEKSQPERRIGVRLRLVEIAEGFQLEAIDKDDNRAIERLVCEKVPAQKVEQARQNLERQLTRLGETEFVCSGLEIDLTHMVFLPLSALNALRRRVIDQLRTERAGNRPRLSGGVLKNNVPFPESRLSYLGNVLNRKAEQFYMRHGVTEIEPAAESGLDLSGRKLWSSQPVMTTKHCLKYEMEVCPRQGKADRLDEPLYLVDEDGRRLRLAFNCRECVMEIYFG